MNLQFLALMFAGVGAVLAVYSASTFEVLPTLMQTIVTVKSQLMFIALVLGFIGMILYDKSEKIPQQNFSKVSRD